MKSIIALLLSSALCVTSINLVNHTQSVLRFIHRATKNAFKELGNIKDKCEVTESCMGETYMKDLSVIDDESPQITHTPLHINSSSTSSSRSTNGNNEGLKTLGSKEISSREIEAIREIRLKIAELAEHRPVDVSAWLFDSCTDIDIIRFIRAEKGNTSKGWEKLLRHARWRITPNGADSIVRQNVYLNSGLHEEIFWLGVDSKGCPTMVGRTMLHDGSLYDEVPQQFTNFLVLLLEEGRQKYGVGSARMACVILDRFPVVKQGTIKKQEVFDLSIIPNVVALLRSLYTTIQDNYPELVEQIMVTPASWFFSSCFRITSTVFDQKTREMFRMVSEGQTREMLPNLFLLSVLPPHLGGSADMYGAVVTQNSLTSSHPISSFDLTSMFSMKYVARAMILLWYPIQLYSCEFYPQSMWCAKLHKLMR